MAYGLALVTVLLAASVRETFCDAELEEHKSLNEIIDATLSSKFDDLFDGGEHETSALDMLRYGIEETTIEPKYLTQVFHNVIGVAPDADISEYKFNLEEAVDMMNKVIKHFQEAPDDAGRPSSSDEAEADSLKMEL